MCGAGHRDPHPSDPEDSADGSIANLAMDYAYLCDDLDDPGSATESHSPILTLKDRATGALFSDVVPQKGVCDYAVKVVVEHILWLGHSAVKLRTDG